MEPDFRKTNVFQLLSGSILISGRVYLRLSPDCTHLFPVTRLFLSHLRHGVGGGTPCRASLSGGPPDREVVPRKSVAPNSLVCLRCSLVLESVHVCLVFYGVPRVSTTVVSLWSPFGFPLASPKWLASLWLGSRRPAVPFTGFGSAINCLAA